MGKTRSKARQNVKTIIENSSQNVKIEFAENIGNGSNFNTNNSGYDDANTLVLPSKKRKTKIVKEQNKITRILSKKQRKKLEKIVDKKQKKEGRSSLLEALASVQLPVEELNKYISISAVQTAGLKNLHKLSISGKKVKTNREENLQKLSSLAGSKKKRRLALLSGYKSGESSDEDANKKKKRDYNIVGLEDSSDDESVSENDFSQKSTEVIEEVLNEVSQKVENAIEICAETIGAESLVAKNACENKPAIYIHVERTSEIQAARLKLPILAEEQVIMEAINENQIIILAGETGSGKTTQIPQFLYEAGYAEKKLIGITEPRRVAAISMSRRVAVEMNLSEKEVSYLIRFEGNVTDATRIKFMTDGVLLKEIESDFLLNKYSVIILDEAHERSSYTDILVGLLSRIVPLRNKRDNPLKLIIMSATLKVEDFISNKKLFKISPPVLKVEARQYPVTIHFQKRTAENYVKEAYKKTLKIHSKLPEGGILIFVTGQQEVNYLVRKLRKMFPCKDWETRKLKPRNKSEIDDENESDIEFDMKRAIKHSKKAKKKLAAQTSLPEINLDNYKLPTDDTDADLIEDNDQLDDSEIETDTDDDIDDENSQLSKQPMWVLPLYSLLSTEKQSRVFQPVPEGCRLCVVSTNVAETSLTIPNIKYVVDSGRQKTRLYDKITGVSSFVVTFTSKASADQRSGRAGRVSAGHCYRLYSSAVFTDEFQDYAIPDIQKKPVDDLVLQMKCMRIDKVVNFPFPSPPDYTQLQMAETRLKLLGALEDASINNNDKKEYIAKVTPLGYAISAFPVAPRFGKMLALSHQKDLLPYTVCLVAALSVQEVLLETNFDDEKNSTTRNSKWFNKRCLWVGTGHSQLLGDPMVLLKAVGASEYSGSLGKLEEFCFENGIRPKAISEIRKLRVQLTNEINLALPTVDLSVDPNMVPPTDLQAKFLRQILLSGMGDHVARKIPDDELKDKETRRKFKYAYNCAEMEEPVFMHSSSVLKKKQPEWVIYQEVYELENGDTRKMFMRGITAIEPEWLLMYVPKLCNIRNIKEDPEPKYNSDDGNVYCYVDASFGRAGWELPLTEVEMPLSEKACRYFGKFFLNGEVFPTLSIYTKKLKSSPGSVLKSWSHLNSRVSAFANALISKYINSKQKLLDVWKSNPNYLLEVYTDLLYDVTISEVSLIWPPTD